MNDVDRIIDDIVRHHFPKSPSSHGVIQEFEALNGVQLPDDMRRLYLAFDGAALFRPANEHPPLTLLSIHDIARARVSIFGQDDPSRGPDSDYTFLDRGDGDYLAVNLSKSRLYGKVIDCWHEAYPDPDICEVVFHSVSDCLLQALRSQGRSIFW